MQKLTHEQHRARAILMGRVYDWRDGSYCFYADVESKHLSHMHAIDAETLEPISEATLVGRANEWCGGTGGEGPGHDSRPRPTPIADK